MLDEGSTHGSKRGKEVIDDGMGRGNDNREGVIGGKEVVRGETLLKCDWFIWRE